MPTAELTSEQIVTKLLSSNEIIKRQKRQLLYHKSGY